ncbi:hypothetical protein NHX12_030316 [Muraenolepis orangiensis]|uniref:Uncharacterized protein n=1 Tax=Muraenolepis orangiensis TaxID=630683 RepID=A0A9Q0E9K9_9TELE|nr:hypothetical protein NHX12_030316 [Muraenolepis orangiensis]
MADRKSAQPRRKEKKEVAEVTKDKKEEARQEEGGPPGEGDQPVGNGETGADAVNGDEHVEPMELPPFEIITGFINVWVGIQGSVSGGVVVGLPQEPLYIFSWAGQYPGFSFTWQCSGEPERVFGELF